MSVNNDLNISTLGHVKMVDENTGEVLLDETNAVHPQNMARVLARGLAREQNSWVHQIKLGNGGTHIDAGLNILYLPPNTVGNTADLYNATYEEVVDETEVAVGLDNNVVSAASPDPAITSVVTCTIRLTADEPSGQAINDGVTTDPDSTYTFDELGLFTSDNPSLMLTHLIFSPIEKTANRSILITYTLTVSVS